MCLAIPAQIISIHGSQALVNKDGLEFEVDISLVPDAKLGDYVVVHVGIALSLLSHDEAHESLSLHQQERK